MQSHHRSLVRKKGEDPPRPAMIILWCCGCKEEKEMGESHANKEGDLYIDHNANKYMVTFDRAIQRKIPLP